MQKVVDTYLWKFISYAALLFVAAGVILGIVLTLELLPFIYAYLLSFIFVGSNFLIMRKIDLNDNTRFVRVFGISMALRFILVIAAIIIGMKALNNHQIFFTVSFIISYICHSVIEIIFLNKILETDTGN